MATSHHYKLILGLGNPGEEYRNTFHNAGFLGLRAWAGKELEFRTLTSRRFEYAKEDGTVYVRPLTYMNESGLAAAAALSYFKLSPAELLVIHDDSDLPLGEGKLHFGRGAGGHHGIESIIAQLGTKDFWRLRLGIRGQKGKAGSFVLKSLSADEAKKIYSATEGFKRSSIENDTPSTSLRTLS